MTEQTYDAIVVGSGISGGWAAKELTENGLKVLMLERGENIEHVTGYVNALKAPWEIPHRDRWTNKIREEQAVLTRDGFMDEANSSYWVKDADSPYVEVRPFAWFRGYHVGGRSLMWGRQSYRWNQWDYEANAKEGVGVDWPIRYEDMAPWYDHAESFAGISGSLEGLPQLPDGKFLPPMELNIAEKTVAARIKEHYSDSRRMIIGRVANLTEPHNGRVNCQYRNKCHLGCPFGPTSARSRPPCRPP
jgi:choline dehydrogenase-like flavoprotein